MSYGLSAIAWMHKPYKSMVTDWYAGDPELISPHEKQGIVLAQT